MCFRPTEISMNKCQACGKVNKPIAKVCEQCGAPLEQVKVDFDADQSKLDAANMAAFGPSATAPKPPTPKAPVTRKTTPAPGTPPTAPRQP